MPLPELWPQLRAALAGVAELAHVDDATALAVAETAPARQKRPAAFLIPVRESANESPFSDERQRVTVDFTVLLAMGAENVRPGHAKTETTLEDTARLEQRIVAALRGAELPQHVSAIQFAGEQLLAIENGVLWRQLNFRTAYLEDSP